MATILSLQSVQRLSAQDARDSRRYYDFGRVVLSGRGDIDAPADIPYYAVLDELTALRSSLQEYLVGHRVNELEGAIRFLTRFASVALGHDGRDWSTQSVQHLAEGLIGCLDLMPWEFERSNLPVIDEVLAVATMSFKRQRSH